MVVYHPFLTLVIGRNNYDYANLLKGRFEVTFLSIALSVTDSKEFIHTFCV